MTHIQLFTAEAGSNPYAGIVEVAIPILVVAFLGFIAVSRARRYFKSDDPPSESMGFSLSDLRDLHAAGRMTDDEFERAKGRIIAASRRAQRETLACLPAARPRRDLGRGRIRCSKAIAAKTSVVTPTVLARARRFLQCFKFPLFSFANGWVRSVSGLPRSSAVWIANAHQVATSD